MNIPDTIGNEILIISIPVTISGSGSNHYYKIDKLTVNLESRNGYISIDSPSQEWKNLYPGGTIFFTTPILGLEKGTDILQFSLNGFNSHENSRFSDSYSHEIIVDLEDGETQELAMNPSTWSIVMDETETIFYLLIKRDIEQINIIPPEEVTVIPKTITSLNKGDTENIQIVINKNKQIEGKITINWIENSTEKSLQISLNYFPQKEEEISLNSLAGRITGMLSLILLICSIVLSGINKTIRKKINYKINSKKRIWLHCYVSWGLFFLSIFHGIVLLIGPYTEFIWMSEIVIGYLTAISMFAVSINGLFIKQISKIIGPRLWRKTHGYYSYLSLILCLIHAFLIGTEFEILRELIL